MTSYVPLLVPEGARHRSAVVTGEAAVLRLAPEIDDLATGIEAGVVGRAVWTMPSLTGTGDDAWAAVCRRLDGRLTAAAVFVDRAVDGERCVTLAGTEGGFGSTMLAEDADAAVELAHLVAGHLVEKACAVDVGPVRGGERVLHELRDLLPGDVVLVDEHIPHLFNTGSLALADYVSHNMRKTLRRASNRLRADGLQARLAFTTEPEQVAVLLPALAAAYRDRDHAKGRPSLLDSPSGRQAWGSRLLELVGSGWGEVVSLLVDDQLVAYVVGVRDGSWYGVREGRFLTAFNRYAPGRLLEAAVVQRALHDPGLVGVDWLSSVAPESLLAANGVDRACRLSVPAPPSAAVLPRQRRAVDSLDEGSVA